MKAYSFIAIILMCCISRHASVEIMPELKRNLLNFGYRINIKYEGMLVHSFDRLYVVTKFILPNIEDLKLLIINLMKLLIIYNRKMDAITILKNIFQILGFIARK